MRVPTYIVRLWRREDRALLIPMIQDCLAANHEAGSDWLPTEKNAEALCEMGMLASEKGEPCMVATTEEWHLGYTLWCELPNPLGLDFRGRVLHGLGTYVMPEYREQGLSAELRDRAEYEAKRLGFTKVVGTAYHQAGLQSVLARNYTIAGYHVERVL